MGSKRAQNTKFRGKIAAHSETIGREGLNEFMQNALAIKFKGAAALKIYLYLRINEKDAGLCLSYAQIGEAISLSPLTVKDAVKKLRSLKFISADGEEGKSLTYKIVRPLPNPEVEASGS